MTMKSSSSSAKQNRVTTFTAFRKKVLSFVSNTDVSLLNNLTREQGNYYCRALTGFKCTRTIERTQRTRARSKSSHAAQEKKKKQRKNETDEYDFFVDENTLARKIPLYFGITGFVVVLLNRAISNVQPTLSAASAASRTDVICVVMSTCLVLTGLTLVAIEPRKPERVELSGYELNEAYVDLGYFEDEERRRTTEEELLWVGKTLKEASGCTSVTIVKVLQSDDSTDTPKNADIEGRVLFYDGICCVRDPKVLFENDDDEKKSRHRMLGEVCRSVLSSGKQNYMANANLFPGRFEFIRDDSEMLSRNDREQKEQNKIGKGFGLPENAQCICVVPISNTFLMILSSNQQRAFTKIDQTWFDLLAQKLDTRLS